MSLLQIFRYGRELLQSGFQVVRDVLSDEWARREVLPGAALHVRGVPLQQALVGVALYVGGKRRTLPLVDQVRNEAAVTSPGLGFCSAPCGK
jgi:hypothetical protein